MNNSESIQNFKVMDWLRATRDELTMQYINMDANQRRQHFAKEQWLAPQAVDLNTVQLPAQGLQSARR
jgi:hypothetical protein